MELRQFIEELGGTRRKMDAPIVDVMTLTLRTVWMNAQKLAPYKYSSGAFRAAWRIQNPVVAGNNITGSVYNDTHYAPAIEAGSTPGYPPWPNPGRRTRLWGGKIWSSQAIGGTMQPAFDYNLVDQTTKNIIDAALSAFADGKA